MFDGPLMWYHNAQWISLTVYTYLGNECLNLIFHFCLKPYPLLGISFTQSEDINQRMELAFFILVPHTILQKWTIIGKRFSISTGMAPHKHTCSICICYKWFSFLYLVLCFRLWNVWLTITCLHVMKVYNACVLKFFGFVSHRHSHHTCMLTCAQVFRWKMYL